MASGLQTQRRFTAEIAEFDKTSCYIISSRMEGGKSHAKGSFEICGIAWFCADHFRRLAQRESKCDAMNAQTKLLPEPTVTYSSSDAKPGQKIEHGELILDVNEARKLLHAQHHPHKVMETRKMPGRFKPPTMKSIKDFAVSKKDLPVINPGPGEYVH